MGSVIVSRKTIKASESEKDKYTVCVENLGNVAYKKSRQWLSFDVNESPRERGWVMIYKDGKVTALFEKSEGDRTFSIYPMFFGTKEECEAEIKRLNLTPLPEENF